MKRRIFIATAVGIAIANATAKAIAAPQMNDKLFIPPDFDDRMTRFMSEPKFLADDTYMGYLPVEHRVAAEKLVNDMGMRLYKTLPGNPSRSYLKQELNETFAWFELSDTEDRDRCVIYLEQILQAVGMSGNDAKISAWLEPFSLLAVQTHPHLED